MDAVWKKPVRMLFQTRRFTRPPQEPLWGWDPFEIAELEIPINDGLPIEGFRRWLVQTAAAAAFVVERRQRSLSAHEPMFRFADCKQREDANLVFRDVGCWDPEAVGPLAQKPTIPVPPAIDLMPPGTKERLDVIRFVTPFAMGARYELDGEIVAAGILHCYSIQSFIQECCAYDRHCQKESSDIIKNSYRHIYYDWAAPGGINTDLPRSHVGEQRDLRHLGFASGGSSGVPMAAYAFRHLKTMRSVAYASLAMLFACLDKRTLMKAREHFLVEHGAEDPDLSAVAPGWLSHIVGEYDLTHVIDALLRRDGGRPQYGWSGMVLVPEAFRQAVPIKSVDLDVDEEAYFHKLGLFSVGSSGAAAAAWQSGLRQTGVRPL